MSDIAKTTDGPDAIRSAYAFSADCGHGLCGRIHLPVGTVSAPVMADPDIQAVFKSVGLCVLTSVVTSWFGRAAFSAAANAQPPLTDVLHALFPDFCDQAGRGGPCDSSPLLAWVANAGPDKVLLVTGFFFFVSLSTAKTIRSRMRLACWFTDGYCYLMLYRALLFSATTLPAPSPLCRGVTSFEDIPSEGWFLSPVYCQDSLFSGHSTMICLACMFISASINRYAMLRALVILWATAACAWIIVLRDHYTSDVLVAALVTFLHFRTIEVDVRKEFHGDGGGNDNIMNSRNTLEGGAVTLRRFARRDA
jgi:hypothetical protein